MLKFFRKIRQHLLKENKFSKYFLYAFGEILLVVIGILIALQVNNWSERKKLVRTESAYLVRLQADITQMKEDYSYTNQYTKQLESAHQALRYLESCGKLPELEKAFKETLLMHQLLSNFFQKSSTYEEMLSIGVFARIENTALKEAVYSVYSWIEGGNESVSYFREDLGRASAIINNDVSFSYDVNNQLVLTYDLSELCDNRAFRNAIVEVIDSKGDWLYIYQNITKELERTSQILEEELEDLK